jgi:hypothetical protein
MRDLLFMCSELFICWGRGLHWAQQWSEWGVCRPPPPSHYNTLQQLFTAVACSAVRIITHFALIGLARAERVLSVLEPEFATQAALRMKSSVCLMRYHIKVSSNHSVSLEWSEFLATDPEVPGSIPQRFHIFWEAAGLERGPLSLVRATEELLEGKSNGSDL